AAHDAGAAAVLPKPVPVERLLALLVEGARTVLVVADDGELRVRLNAALVERGYQVICSEALAEAAERVAKGGPPYAGLQVAVDVESTEPFARRLVDAGARVIVLGMSRDGGEALATLAPRGVLYLGRPFSSAQLLELLGRLAQRDLA